MRIGASTFIWVSPFSNKTLDLFDKVKDFGFDILEIAVEDPNTIDKDEIRKASERTGVAVGVCGAFGPDRDISSDDKSVRENGLAYIRDCVDIAAAVGAPAVAGPMYSAVGKTRLLSPEERENQWKLAVDSMKQAAEYANSKGIKLAVEPLNRFETDLINTVDQGLQLIERVGAANVGFLLDTFNMNIEERSSADAIRKAGDRVFHFHACSNDRGTPGNDQINWDPISKALRDIDYRGDAVIESFTPEIKEIARAVSIWRPIASSQDKLARDGLAFLHQQLG